MRCLFGTQNAQSQWSNIAPHLIDCPGGEKHKLDDAMTNRPLSESLKHSQVSHVSRGR